MSKRDRIVVDAGVLISAFAYGGIPAKAVQRVFKESKIFISPDILEEYRNVPLLLEKRKKITHQQLKMLLQGIAIFVSKAELLYPQEKLKLCRDEKDNMILECCLKANADILITGDKDLLVIEELPFPLSIITPDDFVHVKK